MFNLKKNQKSVFLKLYRYYCTKLLKKMAMALLYFALFTLIMAIQISSLKKIFGQEFLDASWQVKLVIFWIVSLLQLFALWMIMTPLISYLVGRGLGWEELKKKQIFQMPKISREEDIKVVIFTPNVDRETIILAKFAAAFTYFMAFNSLLTLFFSGYFLFFTNFGVMTALLFLLINGLGLALVNFSLIIPYLFYAQEIGSFLLYFFSSFFIILLFALLYPLRHSIAQYPVILYLIFVPLYLLTGYFLFSLYREKFLKSDLD
jgi:hypothetical protein